MTTKLTKSRLRQIIQEELRFKYCESCWVEKDSDEKFEKCPHCKEEMQVDENTMSMVKTAVKHIPSTEPTDPDLIAGLKFFKGKGCDQCDGIGYKGRVGLYEVLQLNNELKTMILKRANALELERTARDTAGMVTLEQCGILKALKGETTLEEVYRVARHSEEGEEGEGSRVQGSETPAPAAEAHPEVQSEVRSQESEAVAPAAQPEAVPAPEAQPAPEAAASPEVQAPAPTNAEDLGSATPAAASPEVQAQAPKNAENPLGPTAP